MNDRTRRFIFLPCASCRFSFLPFLTNFFHSQNILVNFVNKSSPEALPQSLEMMSALMELFPLIPLAKEKYVHSLLSMVIKVEKQLFIEKTSPLRLPLVRFLVRYPKETFENVLNGFSRPDDTHAQRIILVCLAY